MNLNFDTIIVYFRELCCADNACVHPFLGRVIV